MIKISFAESRLLEVLWDAEKPMAVEDVAETLSQKEEGWTEATVRTLMTRLKKKKAVAATKDGRRLFYRPLLERASFLRAESANVVDRLFGGHIGAFVTHFTDTRDLSKEEISELQQLVEKLSHGR